MASYIDLGSSPDPLGDDDMELLPPSSMRPPPPPSSRRITKTISTGRTHTSMLSQSGSRFSTTSSRRSPRKQTFELDVGDEDAPQRLLVTVEANQMMSGMGNNSAMGTQRSNISRRLFAPSSSPARSRSNRRENTTTTTTTLVPLRGLTDDEGGELGSEFNMPRKRGRPLGSKNGTPAPRGKKRSGTPLARQSPAKTRQSKNPESEMSMFSSDAQLDMGTDAVDPTEDDPTPKPKAAPKARKNTPAAKRAGGGTPAVAVPSSSKPTGRKRGRPRKALNHDEMAMLTSEVDNREINSDLLLFSEDPRMKDAPSEMEAIPEGNEDSRSHHDLAPSSSPPRDAPGNYSPPRDENIRSDGPEADLMDQLINDLHEDEHDDHVSYGAMREAESDDGDDASEAPAGSEATDGRQDTLAHASDFSMIAVESLPSFQASFQRSQNEASRFGASHQSRFAEGGDETNYMINRSLRRSMKDSAQGGEPPKFAEGGDETNFMINQSLRSMRGGAEGAPPREEEQQSVRQEKPQLPSHKPTSSILAYSSPSNYVLSSPQTWSKSPKRMRQTPLSRQVFAKSAQKAAPVADDSFSSLPDSVLRDATPGKPRAGKPTDMDIDRTDDTEMQDDSFSEIPDEVLEAATPGPSTRTSKHPIGADNPGSQLYSADVHSAARSANAFGSMRLPTPDDTNSSTTGSKNAHEEEARKGAGESATAVINTSDLNIHSSPPRIGVQSADDVDMQPAQSEGNAVGTPSPNNSSPSPQYPHAKLDSPGLADLLQPPMSTQRPTLSPIVRVGRSLQHVMSDRSSPEGRESSLGSPFRRSGSDSRQSSVQKSPINEKREYPHQTASATKTQSLFNPIASLAQSIRSNFAQVSHRAPSPSTTGRVDDPFGTEKPQLPLHGADAFGRSVAGPPLSDRRHSLQGSVQQLEQFPLLVTSSARADPPSEAFPDWTGEDSSPTAQRTRRMSAPKSLASMNSSNIFAARGTNANSSRVIEDTEEDVAKEEEVSNEQLLSEDQGGVPYQDEQVQGDVHHQDEQDFSDSEQEQFEGGDDMAYEEEESLHESVNEEEEQDVVDNQLQSQANDDEQGHEQPSEGEESLAQSVERDVSEDGRGDEEAMRDDNTVVDEGFDENTRSQHDFDESLESQPNFDMGDDGMDLWDVEASRPTPKPKKLLRAESRARRHSQVDIIARSSQSREPSVLHGSTTTNGDSTNRRSKVPSPWKKNVRRLIYQDEFKSPAHIEMGDSPLSEEPEEEYSLIAQLTAQDEALVPQDQMRPEPQAIPEEEMWSDPQAMPQDSPSPSEEPQQEVPESPEEEVPAQMEERRPEQPTPLPAPRAAEETEDYSMLSQQKPEPPKTLEKPARRSGLFGVFDIMSFFSSPAPLPVTNTPNGAAPETVNRPVPKPHVRSQLSSAAKSQPEEPQSVLRATGLFPSIPQKASFRVSPERQTNLFSPGTALRSGDTVADTYDEMPSTPERQSPLPHIPQKLNFTPRTDRTINTASLFTPSVAPSTPDRNNDAAEDNAPEPEEQDYYLREQESDDYEGDEPVGHEDSVMTVESEYERLPPREKPSKWDKNASPAKSCLRSPLKPKTPGRVVEFAGNNRPVSTSEQIQTWMMGRPALGAAGLGGNSLGQSQGQGRRPQFVEYEEEEEDEDEGDPDDKENSPSPPKDYNNHFPAHFAANNGGQLAMSPAKAVVAPPNIKMPATTAMTAPPNIKMPATTMFRVPNGGQNAANGVKPLFSLQPNGSQNAANGAKALPPISLQPFSRAATNGGGTGSSTVTAPSSGSSTEPLTWQKSHWIHLDELLQLRRNEPAKFRQRQAKFQSQSQSQRGLLGSSSPPRSAALLGKEVSAQGERVVLEPWHLEIVDAFRAEVGLDGGCWDEKSLAKRLFALIVGEERRRRAGAGSGKGRGKKATGGGA
ncbi:hypothetical protein PG999_001722 [Apiospora kogelbergensis]|uniref:Spc7 kinetochore protein domain-containing protein n=1 Tax=Apiospora kogelbergensis TaxID=1337665 RepID=A0AAW0R644_9PEZI